ncbi:unnamed protein product [Protopolystoma xenopodis]|uniref:Uncharacterized protein n=1 Tax=Protopolystoma xenopodis TaxID=117903 RepID=A0A448XKB2_9PLAT|nr:unnamed protein product [Protopolystoma xenopodis]
MFVPLTKAVISRHIDFRELSRRLSEAEALQWVLPELRRVVATWTLDRTIRTLQNLMEVVVNAMEELSGSAANDLFNEALDEISLEVLAQKEAEEAAANMDFSFTIKF